MGGLGNQLFQLAFAHYVAANSDSKVMFNNLSKSVRKTKNGFPELNIYQHTFDLDDYNTTLFSKFVRKLIGLLIRINFSGESNKFHKSLKLFIIFVLNICISIRKSSFYSVFISDNIGFTEWLPTKQSQLCIGYFQTFRYMQSQLIKEKMFYLKLADEETDISVYRNLSEIEHPLLVHIRLDDYRNESKIGTLAPDYYAKAINYQMGKSIYKKIWVFSDEISFFKEYIPQEYLNQVRLIDHVGTNSASLLEVMRMCHGYVIANSTLSWWGAFLSYSKNCTVVYPEPWFAGMPTPIDLIPQDWIPVARD
jgi:hypothetical protein